MTSMASSSSSVLLPATTPLVIAVARIAIAFFSLLPAIYAISVHIFLFAFRERPTLFERRHWSPILLRLGYASIVVVAVVAVSSIHCHYSLDEGAMTLLRCGGGRGECIDGFYGTSTSSTCPETTPQLIIGIVFGLLTIIAVSIKLLLQTRKIEVDGPVPPSHSTETADDVMNHNINYHYDLSGKTILISGAKLSAHNSTACKLCNSFILIPTMILYFVSFWEMPSVISAGIGFETTKQLYSLGANIVLGCRSKQRAVEAMRRIIGNDYDDDDDTHTITDTKIIMARKGVAQKNGRRNTSGRLYFLPLDLSSRTSILKAVRAFQQKKMPLHVLINNAGVMRNRREDTEDGFEMTMAANHLGHFLLTNLLVPKLRETALKEGRSSRVITISSSLHHNATRPCPSPSSSSRDIFRWMTSWRKRMSEPGIDLDDLNCKHKKYTLFGQYSQSKLANVMFAFELNRRESKFRIYENNEKVEKSSSGGAQDDVDDVSDSEKTTDGNFNVTESLESYPQVVSYCVHPGLVRTDFVRDMPWYLYYPNKICYLVMIMLQKTPKSGAYTTVFCSTLDTRMECNYRNDCYFVNSELQPVACCALNTEDAASLWELSSDLVLRPR